MRPANTASHINIWKSPIPYLFGSLGLVLVLIAMALVLLACSYKKRSSNTPSGHDGDQEAQGKPPAMLLKTLDPEPKVVVIMAGEDIPRFIARPSISSSTCCCDQV